jgi:mono/diheme cytochrome c family protein
MRCLLTLIVLALTAPAMAQTAPDPANGLALAEQLCRGCHLVHPRQAGPVPDGVPSFMAIAARPGIDSARIEAVLAAPAHPQMPAPPLNKRQSKDVAAYILSLRPQ